MKTLNTSQIKTRRIVAGAMYDFCAYITSLKKPILVGSSEDVLEVLDVLVEWAEKRGLDITDSPSIYDWNKKV